jgi:hypothetical protein
MGLRNWLSKANRLPRRRQAGGTFRPHLEELEARVVPYSTSGNLWPHAQLVTISFVPDGTNLNGYSSNLISSFNSRYGSPAAWQNVILRAAQVWAQQTNLNFALVCDNGGSTGSGSYQQGDPCFGDIRIGGYNFGNSTTLAQAYLPPPVNNFSIAGDVNLNTNAAFGTTYDLFTVATHEIGHALGLYHSGTYSAEMYSTYNGAKSALTSDDISGIQSVYGGARKPDSYDASASNGSAATASNITSAINLSSLTAVISGDITTTSDQDYYIFTAPSGSSGSLTVRVQSQGLSLLSPKLYVLDGSQNVLGSASGAGQYGTTLSLTVSGIRADSTYYLEVTGADSTAFSTGAYGLTLNLGTGSSPSVPLPDTQTANGNPLHAGGGQAGKDGPESLVNTYTAGAQQISFTDPHAVAMDSQGNYVVTWASDGQDGSGLGVYAQRYDTNGNPLGGEFRVNTTTAGDQTDPTVAMDANGDFVITWSSFGQDAANTWGIYGQRYNAAGVAQGGEFRINGTTAGDQEYANVAMDPLGNVVVTWSSNGQDGNGWGVYARRYNQNGVAQAGEFRVNGTTTGDQMYSTVAVDGTGNFVITWSSNGQDGSGWGVYARRYNASGVAQGSGFRVNTTTTGDQMYSSVAADAAGDFVVTWSSNGQDGSGWGIYAQRYNLLGVAQGGEFQVNTTTAGDQEYSTVAMDSSGNFTIAWSSYGQDGSGWGAYGQQYTVLGTALGGEFQIATSTAGDQKYPDLAMDSLGHMVAVWTGSGASDSSGMYMQHFNTSANNDSAQASDTFSILPDPNARARAATPPATESAASEAAVPTPIVASGTLSVSLLPLDVTRGQTVSLWNPGATPTAGIVSILNSPSEADLARSLTMALPATVALPAPGASLIQSGDDLGRGGDDAGGVLEEDLLNLPPLASIPDKGELFADAMAMTWAPAAPTGAAAWQQTSEAYFAAEEETDGRAAEAAASPESGATVAKDVARRLGPEAVAMLAVLIGSYPLVLRRQWDADRSRSEVA